MSDRDSRRDDDDDGRTIADMSGVDGHGSFFSNMIGLRGDRKRRHVDEGSAETEKRTENVEMTGSERRWYIFGALGASLIIFLAFAVGLTLIVLIWMLFWK